MEIDYRLFVRHLPPDIEHDKLKQLFKKYGTISKVDIKEKSQNDGTKIAFINIKLTEQSLNECFRKVNSTVLSDNHVSVELAKENFFDKLKREREEVQAKTEIKKSIRDENCHIEPINIKIPDKLRNSKQKSVDPLTTDTKLTSGNSFHDFLPQLKRKNPDSTSHKKNVDFNSTSISFGDKKSESELKRLASLKQRKQSFYEKEQLIRNALKCVDTKKNKIVFSDEIYENRPVNNENSKKSKPSTNLHLFEDDENDDDDNESTEITFDVNKKRKPEARTIGNDSRFVIDDRFFDDESKSNSSKGESSESEDEQEGDLTKEKAKELKILENILGKPIAVNKDKENNKNDVDKKLNTMIRYDPTKDDHRKHELKIEKTIVSDPKKKRKKKEETVVEEEPVPINNEIFFSVTDNLKDSLNKREEFSLLKTFGTAENNNDKNNEGANLISEYSIHEPMKDGINYSTRNPFRYDSSDDEAENIEEDHKMNTNEESSFNRSNKNFPTYQGDRFFFKPDDQRFMEAVEFFRKTPVSEEQFKQVRRELKQIVRTKVRNNAQKKHPWKNKKSNVKRRINN